MFIQYNKNNIHALGTPDGKEIKFLRPGWNEFPSNIFKLYEKDPEILRMIADKIIVLMNEKVTVNQGKKKVTKVIGQDDEEIVLKDFSDSKAVEVVGGTLNKDLLQRWDDEENRHKVKRALAAQLKKLSPESEDGKI